MNHYINKKILFTEPYKLEFESCSVGDGPLEGHQMLIRTITSLISPGTELALYTGTHVGIKDPTNHFAKYPFYPGYSVVGEVVEIGKEVMDYKIGDIVYTIGNHAAYNLVSLGNVWSPVIKLDNRKLGEKAVFARLAAICMTSIIKSNIQIGDTAVVLGAGIIGNLAAQLLSIKGAEVIVVDIVEQRLKIAKESGIHKTILSGPSTDLSEKVEELTGLKYADIVIEATGSPKLVIPALELVRPLGQVIALGSTRGNVDLNVYEYIHSKGVNFTGAHERLQDQNGFPSRAKLSKYALKLIQLGALKIDPLITHTLPNNEAKHGYEMLQNQRDEALGVLLDWSS
ncbi:zinc-binding dehydrogenase [Neobacillus drentensis]|uniref:zinc-binding dehydrogenase n=1 Tax=Neobacillus drentensis TaxID=220684 RepID=UPI00082672CD|nr:zinc-binding alcohol dehydrogenase [Neobacillus drentensis]